jgi:large subunit ribosomal protein L22
MKVTASTKEVRTSPRKVRLIADSVRGLSVSEAQDALSVINKRGGYALEKTLKSAIANAINNSQLDRSNLVISDIFVSEGQVLKRYRPSTRGRIHRYQKRSSNVKIVLEEKVETSKVAEPAKIEAQVESSKNENKTEKKGKK